MLLANRQTDKKGGENRTPPKVADVIRFWCAHNGIFCISGAKFYRHHNRFSVFIKCCQFSAWHGRARLP